MSQPKQVMWTCPKLEWKGLLGCGCPQAWCTEGPLIYPTATLTWNSVEESWLQTCRFKDYYLKKIKFPLICLQGRFVFFNYGIKVQRKIKGLESGELSSSCLHIYSSYDLIKSLLLGWIGKGIIKQNWVSQPGKSPVLFVSLVHQSINLEMDSIFLNYSAFSYLKV